MPKAAIRWLGSNKKKYFLAKKPYIYAKEPCIYIEVDLQGRRARWWLRLQWGDLRAPPARYRLPALPLLQCVAVCCSVLQCVAVCCRVLQCVTWRDLMIPPAQCRMQALFLLNCVAVCCCVLQSAAVCCSVLQCVAVWCSVWLDGTPSVI